MYVDQSLSIAELAELVISLPSFGWLRKLHIFRRVLCMLILPRCVNLFPEVPFLCYIIEMSGVFRINLSKTVSCPGNIYQWLTKIR